MYTDMDLEQINKLILEFEKRMKQIDLIITNIVIKEIE
ncbi:hypothetical protein SAMN04489758_1092 [Thomasclavelia cocleata]|uniref:Uncharacterized protein n=1 Tax=Thomasclavelia cocleata TaxID=69824 RepID=A0A1I0E0W2_9FIRM|nr:hypothetical protein SAMN04489758_1092 [Thomasclavelia cocleata]